MNEKTYLINELKKASLEYFNGDTLASNVWINKYAAKNSKGEFIELSPDDTIKRIAKEIHRVEKKYKNPLSFDEIYENLKHFKYFIFGGSILFGAGNKQHMSSLGNCFYADNEADSYGGIFNLDETLAQLMKRRGGVGTTMEYFRPALAKVNNSAQSSTGSVSFMHRFSNTTREVAQDGRRGALMLSTHVKHPDAMDFLSVKDDNNAITGANISVKITDEFMKAVENDEDYIQTFPIYIDIEQHTGFMESLNDGKIEYNKVYSLQYNNDNEYKDCYAKRVKARDLWNKLVQQAHKNAEPGILFWDSIIKESPADCYGDEGFVTKGTNPCISGEALIKTSKGELSIPDIQKLMSSELIKAKTFNENTKKIEYKEILVAQKTKENASIVEIETEDGQTLKLTPDHKVYTENRGWVEAAQLLETDILIKF